MNTLETGELSKLMRKEPRGFLLINVLEPSKFTEEHIPGSINIPVSDEDFVDQVRDRVQSGGDKVVVYCASRECDASPKAAKRLKEAGFEAVYDYEEGIAGWKDADKPVAEA